MSLRTLIPQQQARALLKRLTPAESVYREYRDRVARYLDEHEFVPAAFSHRGMVGRTSKLAMVESELFGRPYLVAYVDAAWLASVEPDCNAIASTVAAPDDSWPRPPVVIVPANRIRSRSALFRSILEHEFVHVNQVLLGSFGDDLPVSARDAIDTLRSRARDEYEASVLELARWPRLLPNDRGYSLEHWSAVRGYSQALERMFVDFAVCEFTPRRVTGALGMLRSALPDIIVGMGSHRRNVAWFLEQFEEHVAIALSHVVQATPAGSGKPSLLAAARWVRKECSSFWDEAAGCPRQPQRPVQARRRARPSDVPF